MTSADRPLPPKSRLTFALAGIGALLFWAGLPPLGLSLLAPVAPVAWVVLVRLERLPGRRPYRAIWLAGFGFWMTTLHWLRLPHPATSIGWVALSFYLAFYLPVFVGLSRVAVHQWRVPVVVAAPLVWTGLELVRSYLLSGFSMAQISHAMVDWLYVIQVADLGGAFLVDLVLFFVAACLARMVPVDGTRWTPWPMLPAAIVLAATLAYGHARLGPQPTGPVLHVALIQGSIDSQVKSDPGSQKLVMQQYARLTQQVIKEHGPLDLIVWPETMCRIPLLTRDPDGVPPAGRGQSREAWEKDFRDSTLYLGTTVALFDTPMLLGLEHVHFEASRYRMYNAAVLITPDGRRQGPCAKQHLVAFGEYVPLADRFAWLQRLTPLPISIDAGESPVAFSHRGVRFASNICYESVLSRVIRRQVTTLRDEGAEPDLLINLTNSGWYYGSSELDLHLACNVFRAVECRKPHLIAANTGISAVIDADGRVVARGPKRLTDKLTAHVQADARESLYLKWGDWPIGTALLFCMVMAISGIVDARRRRPG